MQVLEENNKLSEKMSCLAEELAKRQKKELESELSEKKKELYIENSIPDLLEVSKLLLLQSTNVKVLKMNSKN